MSGASSPRPITMPGYLKVMPHTGIGQINIPKIKNINDYLQLCVQVHQEYPDLPRNGEDFYKKIREKVGLEKRVHLFNHQINLPFVLDRFCHDQLLEMIEKNYLNQPLKKMQERSVEQMFLAMNQTLFPPGHDLHALMSGYRKVPMVVLHQNGIFSPDKNHGFAYAVSLPEPIRDILLQINDKGIALQKTCFQLAAENLLTSEELKVCNEHMFWTAPSADKINSLMTQFIKDLLVKLNQEQDPISIASFAHLKITEIHPFGDGNGRVARAVVNLILMQGGRKPIIFTSITQYNEKVHRGYQDPKIFENYIRRYVEQIEAEETSGDREIEQAKLRYQQTGKAQLS